MLRYATQTGVPIYTIRRSNLQSVLPKLVIGFAAGAYIFYSLWQDISKAALSPVYKEYAQYGLLFLLLSTLTAAVTALVVTGTLLISGMFFLVASMFAWMAMKAFLALASFFTSNEKRYEKILHREKQN